jgi:hypothetical protein
MFVQNFLTAVFFSILVQKFTVEPCATEKHKVDPKKIMCVLCFDQSYLLHVRVVSLIIKIFIWKGLTAIFLKI